MQYSPHKLNFRQLRKQIPIVCPRLQCGTRFATSVGSHGDTVLQHGNTVLQHRDTVLQHRDTVLQCGDTPLQHEDTVHCAATITICIDLGGDYV